MRSLNHPSERSVAIYFLEISSTLLNVAPGRQVHFSAAEWPWLNIFKANTE